MKKITFLLLTIFVASFFGATSSQANSPKEVLVEVQTIGELRAGETDGTVYLLTGEAILTYQQSFRNKKWIQDETAGIEIDDNEGIITTVYEIGDGITGIEGTLNFYNNNYQFVPVSDPGAPSSSGNEPTIVERTLTDITAADQGRLVVVSGLLFDASHHGTVFETGTNYTVSDPSGDGVLRTNFYDADYIGAPIPEQELSVIAIVHMFNDTKQITPRFISDMGITDMHNIETLRNQEVDGVTEYTLTNEAVLTFQQSYRNQKFIEDETAGILIDDNSGIITTAYSVYDGITGIKGTLSTYGNMLQFVPVEDPGAATSVDNEIIPPVLSLNDFNENFMDYQARLVSIENIEFNVVAGTEFANGTAYEMVDIIDTEITGSFRTSFYNVDYIGDLVPAGPVLITGLPNSTNDGNFITARNWNDIEALTLYSVTFDVTDEADAPIADAEITFLGETHAPGTYLFEDVPVGTHQYQVYKDGYHLSEGDVTVIDENITHHVVLVEIDADIVTEFPWTEDFEADPLTWNHFAYGEGGWEQSTSANSGDYAAYHNFTTLPADSWLITPQISVPAEGIMLLKFFENNGFMPDYGYSGVLISTASGNPEHGDFVEVYESAEAFTNYTEKSINLADYAGQVIYIAFVYQGENGHRWYIDDVSVEAAPETTEVNDLATLREQDTGDLVYRVTGEVILTHQNGNRNQKYFQDETAAILIDDPDGIIATEYNTYDGITGLTGKLNVYNEMLQFVPTEDPGDAVSTDNTVEPLELTLTDLAPEHQAMLIIVKAVSFDVETDQTVFEPSTSYNIFDATDTGILRTPNANADLDYFDTEIPTTTKDIIGVINQYQTDVQIMPRSLADFIDTDDDDDDTNIADHNDNSSISIYPNPANNYFVVSGNDLIETVNIYNINGQLVKQISVNDNIININTNSFSQGIYFIQVQSGNSVSNYKLQIQK